MEGKLVVTILSLTGIFVTVAFVMPENTVMLWTSLSGILAAAGLPAIASGVMAVGKRIFRDG